MVYARMNAGGRGRVRGRGRGSHPGRVISRNLTNSYTAGMLHIRAV